MSENIIVLYFLLTRAPLSCCRVTIVVRIGIDCDIKDRSESFCFYLKFRFTSMTWESMLMVGSITIISV